MKKLLLFLVFMLSLTFAWSQTNERIKINGIILSDNQDVEGVTIFNTSSNKGTISNEKGEFTIEVTLNDRIEISALQFNPTVVVVDEFVIAAKQLKIYLIEKVNQLGAVLLSYGLSGNLNTDIDKVVNMPLITIDVGNMGALENVDKAFDNTVVADALNRTIYKGQIYNGVNFVEISKLIFKPKKKVKQSDENLQVEKPKELMDVYSPSMISKIFNLPENEVSSFIAFLESKDIDQELFKAENELKLIQYLVDQRKLFLESNNDRN